MKKENRLKKNYQFQKIIEQKKQVVTKDLIIYYQNNNQKLRVGISISKKMANAVNRNKYRRQIRSILDILKPWDIKKDIVIIVRKPFFNIGFEEKVKSMKEIFERL